MSSEVTSQGLYPEHPVPPGKQRSGISSWGLSQQNRFVSRVPTSPALMELAGMDVTSSSSHCLSDPQSFLGLWGDTCLTVPSFLLSLRPHSMPVPSARPRTSCEESALSEANVLGFCLPGAHGSFAGCGHSSLCMLHVWPFLSYSRTLTLQSKQMTL